MLLSFIALPTPHAAAFSNGQLPAIRIGEQRSQSYGVLTPWGGLAFDRAGNLWVADSSNNRVLEFTPPFTDTMGAAIVIGQPNFQATKTGVAGDRLNYPLYVTFDQAGDLWVSDVGNNRLLEFQPPLFSGMSASVVIGPGDIWLQNFYPGQVAFDSSGNLWVPDGAHASVLEYQPPFRTGMSASLVLGDHSTLSGPGEVAFDKKGNLWVTENFSPTFGIVVFKPPFTRSIRPWLVFNGLLAQNLAFDSSGNLWIACWFCGYVAEYKPPFDENSIRWEKGPPKKATTVLGGYSIYCCNANPDQIPNVITPTGLAFDSAGNLWIVDSRATWLTYLLGRIVGYDSQVHPLDTQEGRVYFETHGGLLAPLFAIPSTTMNGTSFPQGLFNFTIQGLQPGGSVTLTITFANPLIPTTEWLSKSNGHWSTLPANQTSIHGNNMTLTLGNASRIGVLSVIGGPGYSPPNLTSPTETLSRSIIKTEPLNSQNEALPLRLALEVMAMIVIVAAVAVAIRKRTRSTRTEARAIA